MEKQQVRTHTYFISMKEYKKQFLKQDISPELESRGIVVVITSLQGHPQK